MESTICLTKSTQYPIIYHHTWLIWDPLHVPNLTLCGRRISNIGEALRIGRRPCQKCIKILEAANE